MRRYRAQPNYKSGGEWTILGFPTLKSGAMTVRKGHGHTAPQSHEAVDVVPASQLRGAVAAERDWLERILHADQRSDERVWATLANARMRASTNSGGGRR